jgi:hypothetical protein
MTEISDKDIREALDRIARTRDGEVLYLYLQKFLIGVSDSTDVGVLQSVHGARSFARDLMAHMGQGVAQSARSGCITFVVGPRAVPERRRPGARLVSIDSRVPGYDGPEPEDDNRPGPAA